MPTLGDALGDGAITAGHLDAIANATAKLTDDQKASLRHPRGQSCASAPHGCRSNSSNANAATSPAPSSPNQSTTTASSELERQRANEQHPLVDRPRDRHGPHPHRTRPRIPRQDPRLDARQAPLAQAPTGPTIQRRPARTAAPTNNSKPTRSSNSSPAQRLPSTSGSPKSSCSSTTTHCVGELARQLAVRNDRRHPDPGRDRPALLLHRQHHPRRPRIRRTTTRRRRRLTTRHTSPTPGGVLDVPHLRRPRLLHPGRRLRDPPPRRMDPQPAAPTSNGCFHSANATTTSSTKAAGASTWTTNATSPSTDPTAPCTSPAPRSTDSPADSHVIGGVDAEEAEAVGEDAGR